MKTRVPTQSDQFSMEFHKETFTDRTKAVGAVIFAAAALKPFQTTKPVGNIGGFPIAIQRLEDRANIVIQGKNTYTAHINETPLGTISSLEHSITHPRSNVRLIRAGAYPPIRGTSFRAGEVTYLYTTGYLPSVGGFQQGHVPSPLELTDHIGDTAQPRLMREILALTKMNWNSARMYGLMPITLRFSRLVGDILREFTPEMGEPSPKYNFIRNR